MIFTLLACGLLLMPIPAAYVMSRHRRHLNTPINLINGIVLPHCGDSAWTVQDSVGWINGCVKVYALVDCNKAYHGIIKCRRSKHAVVEIDGLELNTGIEAWRYFWAIRHAHMCTMADTRFEC